MKNTHAFPFKRTAHNGNEKISCDGMTLRQYYAAHAMQAMITKEGALLQLEDMATLSFEVADAMLAVENE